MFILYIKNLIFKGRFDIVRDIILLYLKFYIVFKFLYKNGLDILSYL